MRYNSKIYGRIEWPWWHDALIIGAMLLGVFTVSRIF